MPSNRGGQKTDVMTDVLSEVKGDRVKVFKQERQPFNTMSL